jgi:hypothetical protein
LKKYIQGEPPSKKEYDALLKLVEANYKRLHSKAVSAVNGRYNRLLQRLFPDRSKNNNENSNNSDHLPDITSNNRCTSSNNNYDNDNTGDSDNLSAPEVISGQTAQRNNDSNKGNHSPVFHVKKNPSEQASHETEFESEIIIPPSFVEESNCCLLSIEEFTSPSSSSAPSSSSCPRKTFLLSPPSSSSRHAPIPWDDIYPSSSIPGLMNYVDLTAAEDHPYEEEQHTKTTMMKQEPLEEKEGDDEQENEKEDEGETMGKQKEVIEGNDDGNSNIHIKNTNNGSDEKNNPLPVGFPPSITSSLPQTSSETTVTSLSSSSFSQPALPLDSFFTSATRIPMKNEPMGSPPPRLHPLSCSWKSPPSKSLLSLSSDSFVPLLPLLVQQQKQQLESREVSTSHFHLEHQLHQRQDNHQQQQLIAVCLFEKEKTNETSHAEVILLDATGDTEENSWRANNPNPNPNPNQSSELAPSVQENNNHNNEDENENEYHETRKKNKFEINRPEVVSTPEEEGGEAEEVPSSPLAASFPPAGSTTLPSPRAPAVRFDFNAFLRQGHDRIGFVEERDKERERTRENDDDRRE